MPDNQFLRDASDRLTFEMFRVPSSDYAAICKTITDAFSLTPQWVSFGVGLDVIFQDYYQGELVVEMAWDNWSGFFVTAKIISSETLVQQIGEWLLQNMATVSDG